MGSAAHHQSPQSNVAHRQSPTVTKKATPKHLPVLQGHKAGKQAQHEPNNGHREQPWQSNTEPTATPHLLEANVVGVLAEAATADVQAVLADQAWHDQSAHAQNQAHTEPTYHDVQRRRGTGGYQSRTSSGGCSGEKACCLQRARDVKHAGATTGAASRATAHTARATMHT